MRVSGGIVLVTGCSSGIGRATARLLAERGFRVLAGVHCDHHLHEVVDDASPTLEHLQLDVTNEDDIAQVVARIRDKSPTGLTALVNNAGIGLPAPVELTTPEQMRQLLEVNTIGPLKMIQACLPLLRQSRGRIINMSSMNGTISMPMVGGYSASKFALEALSDALRVELRPWQISVSVIRPGQVRTSIFDKAREALAKGHQAIPNELKAGYDALYARTGEFNERGAKSQTTPDHVARTVLRAIEARRPRDHYLIGTDAWMMQLATSLLPQWMLDHLFAQVMRIPKRVD